MKKILLSLVFLLAVAVPREAFALKRIIEVLAAGVTDSNNAILSAGTVTFYDAGTSTLRTVYTDFALTTPASNPATLDSAGRLVVYTDKRVKLLIKNSGGSTIHTWDNVGTADSDISAATASNLAGDGLTAPGDGTVAVYPDGASLEISSDKVRVIAGGISQGSQEILNHSCAASVGSSALTIALKDKSGSDPSSTSPVTIPFRSATAATGTYAARQVTAALSVVVSSGSKLGHTDATEWPIYVYALDNAGTVELAVSTSPYDERYTTSTTAEGGAGAADSVATIYSTSARSTVAIRLLCVMKSTQTTAGTWAAVPTTIGSNTSGHPLSNLIARTSGTTVGVGGVAKSGSSGNYTRANGAEGDVTNLSVTITTTGRPVWVGVIHDGDVNTSYFSISNTTNFTFTGTAYIYRDATQIAEHGLTAGDNSANTASLSGGVGTFYTVDFPAAGTYTYKVAAHSDGGNTTLTLSYVRLVAYEL